MKNILLLSLFSMITISLFAQTKVIEVPMTAEHWQFDGEDVEFVQHRGTNALYHSTDLPLTIAKNINFTSGTIEFDLEPTGERFASIYFRRKNDKETECFYFRNYRAGNPMGFDAIQYASIIDGVTMWDVQPHYQAPANIKKEGWNHVKMVISGEQMLVYVNDMQTPALHIAALDANTSAGGIAFNGTGYFANLVIKPTQTEGLADKAAYDPTRNDPTYLRNWEVSEAIDLPFGQDVLNTHFPIADSVLWSTTTSERLGFINLTRKYGGTKRGTRRLAWLKTTITADANQIRKLHLGFSDEVWVYINGELLYLDKNYYRTPIMKAPNGRLSTENTSFDLPLKEGENELLIGVGNSFFAWGIIAKLDRNEGLKYK